MLSRRDSLLTLLAATLTPSLAKAMPRPPLAADPMVTRVAVAGDAPLSPRGLENLIAFTRLLGYIRHFHPSDQAAATDWQISSRSPKIALTRRSRAGP